MKDAIKIISLVLGILPQLIEMVKAIEVPANGESKKEFVLAIVRAAMETFLPDTGIDPDKLISFVSKAVDLIVSFLNRVGIFKKA